MRRGWAEREGLGGLAGLTGEVLSSKPWGAQMLPFLPVKVSGRSWRGRGRVGRGSSAEVSGKAKGQGPRNQQPTIDNCRATTLAASEPDSVASRGPRKTGAGGRDTHTRGAPSPMAAARPHLACAPTSAPIAAGRTEELNEGPGARRHVPRKALPTRHSAPFISHTWPERWHSHTAGEGQQLT